MCVYVHGTTTIVYMYVYNYVHVHGTAPSMCTYMLLTAAEIMLFTGWQPYTLGHVTLHPSPI